MSTSRATRALGATLVATLVLAGCSGDDAGPETEETSASAAADPVDEDTPDDEMTTEDQAAAMACDGATEVDIAHINDPPKFAYSTPRFTETLGYFEMFCLDAEVTAYSGGIRAVQAVQAGEAQIGMGPTTSFIAVVAGGSEMTGFGGPASRLPQQIVVTEEIESCEDLEGQTVATGGPGDLVHFLMTMFLDNCGLTIGEDVNVLIGGAVDLGPYLADGLAQGSATHPEESAILLDAVGVDLTSLGGVAEVAPNFHYMTLLAYDEFLADPANRETAVRATAAMMATNRFMSDPANEEQVIELLRDGIIAGDTEGVPELGYERYASLLPTTCDEGMNPEDIEWTINWAFEAGEIEEAMAVDDLMDMSICEEAEAMVDAVEDLSPPNL